MTTRILILCLSLFVALAGAGCRTKAKKVKDHNVPAAEMEANFKQRWIERRTAELTNAGTTSESARAKAEAEFKEKFPYVRAGQSAPSK